MVHVYLIRCCAILVILCELQEYPIIFLFTCHANTILPNIDCVLVIVERHLVGRKGSKWITMLMKMTVKMMDINAVLMNMTVKMVDINAVLMKMTVKMMDYKAVLMKMAVISLMMI